MTRLFKYSQAQIDFLRAGYPKMTAVVLTAAFNQKFNLNKSVDTIKSTLTNHKLRCGRPPGTPKGQPRSYTAEQKAWIAEHYPLMKRQPLTEAFNQTFNETRRVGQITAFVKNHKIKSGRNGCFVKGQTSWNAGLKGVLVANSGSFKKGHKPINHRTVGSERTNVDGYIEIKIAEPSTWAAKHRVIWEQAHGPIPKNYNIRFKDGDPLNINIDNLVMVNKSEHKILNKMDYINQDDEHKDTVLLIARVKSKTSEVMRNG